MTRILVDLTHTSHTRAHTGIQRLCRALREALRERADEVVPVCHDPYESTWRPLRRWEERTLAPPRGRVAGRRGSRWPLSAKIGGLLRRWLDAHTRNRPARALAGDWLIEPEIFSPTVGRAQPALFAGISGPRVALFHDAAALRLPELAPHKTVARYPVYLQELLRFDGIAAISDESRRCRRSAATPADRRGNGPRSCAAPTPGGEGRRHRETTRRGGPRFRRKARAARARPLGRKSRARSANPPPAPGQADFGCGHRAIAARGRRFSQTAASGCRAFRPPGHEGGQGCAPPSAAADATWIHTDRGIPARPRPPVRAAPRGAPGTGVGCPCERGCDWCG